MLFNKKKYYNYITTKEAIAEVKIMLILVICIIIAIIINHIFIKKNIILITAIGAIVGIILGYWKYRKEIIKIEEMKMKLDIYEKIMKE